MKVRIYCHLGLITGYGVAAHGLCMSLLSAGVELEIRPLVPYEQVRVDPSLPLARCIRRDFELDPSPDVVIVHTLPMDCAKVIEHTGLNPVDVPFVAYTTWEGVGPVPEIMSEALSPFDVIWTPSTVNADSFERLTERMPERNVTKVQVMPHAFDEASREMRRAPRPVHMDDGVFKFYCFGAWTCRKNPEGVLRAYTRAFGRTDKVALIIRATQATEEEFAMAWYRTGFTQATSPPVIFGCKPVTDAAVVKLHQEADCYVTASRGEAWNLPAFEAMLAGRHVISPRGLGSDEFLKDTSAALYDGWRAPAGCDVQVIPSDDVDAGPGVAVGLRRVGAQEQTTRTDWLEPDLNALAELMYVAYKGGTRDIAVNYDVAERFGYTSVGAKARTLLEAL